MWTTVIEYATSAIKKNPWWVMAANRNRLQYNKNLIYHENEEKGGTLQHTAYRHARKWLQYTATHCNTLQHTAYLHAACPVYHENEEKGKNIEKGILQNGCNRLQQTATDYNRLQHTATYCNRLQQTTTDCNSLQQTATDCNRLQQTAYPIYHKNEEKGENIRKCTL